MKIGVAFILLFLSINVFAQKKIGKDVGIWEVQKGEIITGSQYNNTLGVQYWNFINELLPHDLTKEYVHCFRIYTDGEEGDLGGMTLMNESNKDWQLEIDIADLNLEETDESKILDYQHTLIHEFGHLLTLNITQIEPTNDEYQDDTKGYLTSEGYARKDSYLQAFVTQFWPDEILFQWDKIDQMKNQKKKEKRLFDFYLDTPRSFVTDYAAESPEEDIAESWTYFVLDEIKSGNTIKEQKVAFFYNYPELVQYRDEIRTKLKFIPKNYLMSFRVKYED
ncbi:putative zinc-binding metallopeptidase [Flammeovirga sp. OC4]|uniref:putative zinc-binding metallopeptidase n=1 Tax=Flammeovirga sp. OC4 TaxID=1382345 RepID=UPI000694B50C|nr:putative zinc-binding metallopeptidase [Flammeovirga sp. OC4]